MSKTSSNFREDWFYMWVNSWTEGPRVDFKYTWKDAFLSSGTEKDILNREYKWARHLIAFGNVSLRTGKCCYIVFGVKDQDRDIVGISPRDFIDSNNIPEAASNPFASNFSLIEDGVHRPLVERLRNWISPELPETSIEFGYVEDQHGSQKLVAYLIIDGRQFDQPFVLSRPYQKYKKGQPFIRKGSCSLPLAMDQVIYIKKPEAIAYLSRNQWDKLIGWSKSGDFEKSYNYPFYMAVKDLEGKNISETLYEFPDGKDRRLYLIGKPGSGKSNELRRLAVSLANRHSNDTISREFYGQHESPIQDEDKLIVDVGQELEVTPLFPIPLYYSLRTAFDKISDFQREIETFFQGVIGSDLRISLNSLFSVPGSKWILILDGLDELHDAEDCGAMLDAWIKGFPPNVKIIISSRPGYNLGKQGMLVQIAELDSEEIIDHIERLAKSVSNEKFGGEDDTVNIADILKWLTNDGIDVLPLLRNFRAIIGFLNYFYPRIDVSPAEADIPTVEVISPHQYSSSVPRRQRKIPFYDPEEFVGQFVSDFDKSKEEKRNTQLSVIKDALIIQHITNYLREENILRQPMGSKAKRVDEESRAQLEATAWHSDWGTPIIRREKYINNYITDKSLKWNEELGFIQYQNPYTYKFITSMYQLYLAAEYSCWQDEHTTPENKTFSSTVHKYHAQLMESMGKLPTLKLEDA